MWTKKRAAGVKNIFAMLINPILPDIYNEAFGLAKKLEKVLGLKSRKHRHQIKHTIKCIRQDD